MPDPEFRYGPGLATDIELRWQERWAAARGVPYPNPADGDPAEQRAGAGGRRVSFHAHRATELASAELYTP